MLSSLKITANVRCLAQVGNSIPSALAHELMYHRIGVDEHLFVSPHLRQVRVVGNGL